MKILSKWSLLFVFTGAYVFLIAGLFYQNLFQWYFDEKLKQEVVALLYVNQNRFLSGVASSPKVVTIEEVDTMKNFTNDTRVVDALLVNKYGQVRWCHKDPLMFGKRIEDYQNAHPLPTDAVARAYVTRSPKVLAFQLEGKSFYEVAVPLVSQGDIKGVVSLQISRQETEATLAQGMRRFYIGALIVVGIFLLTGILFIQKSVTSPLTELKETLDSIAISSPVWPETAKFRTDEIGILQRSLAAFLDKLRMSLARFEKDKKDVGELEKTRWEQILNVLVRSGSVIVLDADNYVMAGHNLSALMVKAGPAGQPRAKAFSQGQGGFATEQKGAATASRLHLLDFVTSTELLQLVNKALERPGHFSDGTVILEQKPFQARIVTIPRSQGQDQRTLVLLDEGKV
ncbi:MAG: hypothetical protein HY401_03265 [Elusimicrobia bacterium]|nr:hypothetical protein [Elusimicrobiota bacterium]